MIVNNPDTGADTSKPAMYIEANIHGNEIQGGEICIYTIWYLMENYGKIERITKLVNERAFYIVPDREPGRARLLHARPRRQRALGAPAGRRRQRLPVRRGRAGGSERERHHRADPQVRSRPGHAPEERDQPARARTGRAGRVGRLHPARPGRHRPRRRRPRRRGRARQLRPQPQLPRRLAAELRAGRRDGLPVPAARGEGRQRLPAGASRTWPACRPTTTAAA